MALDTKDLDGLKDLLIKSEEYTQLIFDWVGPLQSQYMLGKMYDFRNTIEEEIKRLKELQAQEEKENVYTDE